MKIKKFRLADMNNGAFGDVYQTLEAAEKALLEEIALCQAEDEKLSADELGGMSLEDKKTETAAFFCIVDAETGAEV